PALLCDAPRVLLFVYGSLLRGEDNHAVLTGARFVATARTAPRYTLVDLGPYPALVLGGDTAVSGELFEVSPALLAELDDFEGHPDFYVRSPVDLSPASVPASLPPLPPHSSAQAYLLPPERAAGYATLPSGDWRAHRAV
ncbi:MAG: gamma-glutamylcyclotransferase family protein, partial [Polyangiaceae bacterium]